MKILAKSVSQYFFIRRAHKLGGMRIHTAGFPQTLPYSAQKLCPNKFWGFFMLISVFQMYDSYNCTALSQSWDLAPTIRRFDHAVARCSPTICWWWSDLLVCSMWFFWAPSYQCHYLGKVTLGASENRIIHCTVLHCTLLREIRASQTLPLNPCKGGHKGIRWKTSQTLKKTLQKLIQHDNNFCQFLKNISPVKNVRYFL